MTRRSPAGFKVTEIRGRLLRDQLKAEALGRILHEEDFTTHTAEPPHFPTLASTDTGTMRAIVITAG